MEIAQISERSPGSSTKRGDLRRVSTVMYDLGFFAGVMLAFACFVAAAWYLFAFLDMSAHGLEQLLSVTTPQAVETTQLALNVQAVMNKMALLSCGVFSGMAFGFLGFALFLIGVRGEVELTAESAKTSFHASRLAPGLFVIICASIIISLSVTQQFTLDYQSRGAGAAPPYDFTKSDVLEQPLGAEADEGAK